MEERKKEGDMCTGLSEIHNHTEQLTPLLGSYMYTKLQTQ